MPVSVETPVSELEERLRDAEAEIAVRDQETDYVRQYRTYLATLLAHARFGGAAPAPRVDEEAFGR